MNSLQRLSILAIFAGIGAFTAHAANVDSPELLRARADLVEEFKQGRTDDNNTVKQLRARIAALEFIDQNSSSPQSVSTQLINVTFPGGPFSALVAATASAEKNGSTFNVIGEKADLSIDLPPFAIRNADANSLAVALDGLLQPRGYTLRQTGRPVPGQAPVFTLRQLSSVETAYEKSQIAQRTGQFQSFQLGSYLGEQSVDDIVGAIRTAWELDPSHNSASLRLKFHPPTGILLVSGPPEGVVVVQAILRELRRPSPPPAPKTSDSPKEAAPPAPQNPKK